ncbi:MAG: class B sortase [Ruminococcus sp.]|nr:class B sortase [Ruminococcus sp.]
MNVTKIISIISACTAAVSLSASVLMMRQKDDDSYIPTNAANQEFSEPEPEQVNQPEIIPCKNEESEPDTEAEEETEEEKKPVELDLPLYDYVPSNSGMTEPAKLLMNRNNDAVGWLKINGTQVNYPVLIDPGEIFPNTGYGDSYVEYNAYYLKHNIDRVWTFDGNIFMDCRDNFGSDEDQQSENIVIYGHNMLNGSQFGNLGRYRENGYYYTNPFVYLSSNYKDYEYVIVSYCITSGNADTDFRYWDMQELDTQEDFDYYVNRIKRDQFHDTGVDIKYGDKLLTLSTCYSDADNSRFIVLARRLRDGEVAGDFSTIQKTPPIQNRSKPIIQFKNKELLKKYYELRGF